MNNDYRIREFDRSHHSRQVVELWRSVFGYETAHNEPVLIIEKKEQVSDGLFFVAETDSGEVIGTIMGGYDGHRGWIYSLAVSPDHRGRGVGGRLMACAEDVLKKLGCMKINLQILEDNKEVERFYKGLGYTAERRISMGKHLPENLTKVEISGYSDDGRGETAGPNCCGKEYDEKLVIQSGGVELLEKIQPLWERLKSHHIAMAGSLAGGLVDAQFQRRCEEIRDKGRRHFVEIVTEADSEGLVGYCLSTVNDRMIGEIDSIFVCESFRGRGVGRRLVQRSVEWMKANGSKRERVNVMVENIAAERLYRSFGFVPRQVELVRETRERTDSGLRD